MVGETALEALKVLSLEDQREEGRNGRRRGWRRGREGEASREEELLRFSERREDKEETRSLYEGEKDELTFLQPLLGLESIMSLIRRFREPTFGRPPPSSAFSLSLFSLDYFKPNKVGAIQLTRRAISAPSP